MPQIRVNDGPQKGKVIPIERGQKLLVGRDPSCAIRVLDQGVSREHAQVQRLGELVFIKDLGSLNGTYVNEERMTEDLLREGDLLRVGNTHMVFEATRESEVRSGDLVYDDGQEFNVSLDLKLDDLYALKDVSGRREADLFQGVCRAAKIIQSEQDEDRLLERVLDLIHELVRADYLYVFYTDPRTGQIGPRFNRGKGPGGGRVPISRTIFNRVITESRAILTGDAMQDARFQRDDSVILHNIRSVLCVPIRGSGAVCGAFYAVNLEQTTAFEESDLQLLTVLGAQVAAAIEGLRIIRDRRRLLINTIGRMVSLLEGAPAGRCGHAQRVSNSSAAIAAEMGLSEHEALFAAMAGLLHDIGRLPAIAGPARATAGATETHILAGLDFLREIPDLLEALPAIEAHHEKYDGTGEPQRLKGNDIPLLARIVAVANDLDKLVFPPDQPLPAGEPDAAAVRGALLEVDAQAGKLYDPLVVGAAMVAYRHGTLRFSTRMRPVAAASALPEAPAKGTETGVDNVAPLPPKAETVRTERNRG